MFLHSRAKVNGERELTLGTKGALSDLFYLFDFIAVTWDAIKFIVFIIWQLFSAVFMSFVLL